MAALDFAKGEAVPKLQFLEQALVSVRFKEGSAAKQSWYEEPKIAEDRGYWKPTSEFWVWAGAASFIAALWVSPRVPSVEQVKPQLYRAVLVTLALVWR
ncbi:MAG: hypothetical protein LBP88_06525 [Treponema sp.]|nr:hypothetical protein [Treponema sp.]